MANELLDFVMALVRDPDAAARYAADPGRAIADAHLAGVTSADVGNLLPMMSESLAMSTPVPAPMPTPMLNPVAVPSDASDAGSDSVWTSGAATAAFDAFTPRDAASAASVINIGHAVVEPLGAAGVATSAQFVDTAAVPPVAVDDGVTPVPDEAGGDAGSPPWHQTGDPSWHHAADVAHSHVDPGFDHFV